MRVHLARSLCKMSVRALLTRSLHKPPYHGSLGKLSEGCLVLCEPPQSNYTWTFQKSHFVSTFLAKILDAATQSKCAWTCHRKHFVELWRENAGHPCLASLRSRHAHGHFTRTICVEIYKVNAGRYCVTPRFMRACALQMCILCVEIYRANDGCHSD